MDTVRVWKLRDLDCAECGARVEAAVNAMPGVRKATVDYMQMKMTVQTDVPEDDAFWKAVEKTAHGAEDEMEMREMKDGVCPYCGHERCTCCEAGGRKKRDPMPLRILSSAILFILSMALRSRQEASMALALLSYAIAGYDVLINTVKNLFKGKMLDEHFLMAVASVGAMVLKDWREAAAVMIFYQIGEYFQEKAVDSSRRNIASLLDLESDTVTVVREGRDVVVEPDDVRVGETVKVKNGEKIPLDGVIVSGSTLIDTKNITGEPVPRRAGVGDSVVSGCVNAQSVITIRTTSLSKDSTVSKITKLVENSSSSKAKSEQFITRFARVYTPSVVGAAFLLALIGSLATRQPSVWIYRAFVFLVISCPCALVVSVPLAYFSGIGALAKRGVMVKGGNWLQTLSECDTFAFDKTGTLTDGTFAVTKTDVWAGGWDEDTLLRYAASLEKESTHPIAHAVAAVGKDLMEATDVEERAGRGLVGRVDGHAVACGNAKLLSELGIPVAGEAARGGSTVMVAVDGVHVGTILVSDSVKKGVPSSLQRLRNLGVKRLVMLTGDEKRNAEAVAEEIGIDTVKAGLLPTDKTTEFGRLKDGGHKVAYTGDGINDAPVLALSDVGLAMGALGSDAAIESADIVLMTDDFSRVADARRIAMATSRVAKENIALALAVKFAALVLGALGLAGMWMAIFADTGVAILCVLNSLRILLSRR